QFDDAAFKSLNRDGFTFVNHQLISTIWKLNCTRQSLVKDSAGRWPVFAESLRQAHPSAR
ncbi:hypothetical protein, partial [Pseudomonas sp.]|uniref:hypothetical protein n=1 Tax=Pseudomonas sp. TaxID=306 RepID=UPI002FCB18F7